LENTIVIDYQGRVKYETIGELIHKFKNQIHTMGIQTGTYKKLLLVMIESLENIMKYSESPDDATNENQLVDAGFSILKTDTNFIIISFNSISNRLIPGLKERLDHLNKLNLQELKDYYKQTITNGQFTNTGGAGLGLIEIAKISGKMIRYDFNPIDKNYARYTQWVTIDA